METTYPGFAWSFALIQGTRKWTIFYVITEFSHKINNNIEVLKEILKCIYIRSEENISEEVVSFKKAEV